VDNADAPELQTRDIKRFLDEAAALGSLKVKIGGGEPFTRKDCMSIIEYARELDLAVSVFTNASLIDRHIAGQLRDLKVYIINVSIYGSIPRIHDNITGIKGSFDALQRGIDCLLEAGISPYLSMVIMKENYNDLDNVMKLVREKTGREPKFTTEIFPKYNHGLSPIRHRISDTELEEFYNLHIADKRFLNIGTFDSGLSCNAATFGCFVSACGDVFACASLRVKGGNIMSGSFNDIWHGKAFERLRVLTMEDFPLCKDCELLPGCPRCLGLSFLEYRDYTLPPPRICLRSRIFDRLSKEKIIK
jgi:radical SAM protein with 4Fe4S-binding SPASM domain